MNNIQIIREMLNRKPYCKIFISDAIGYLGNEYKRIYSDEYYSIFYIQDTWHRGTNKYDTLSSLLRDIDE